nr:hypothetical protein PJ912_06475 [Pectobacterium colocasium]
MSWLLKAAELGNRDAQYQLAQRYEQGNGVVIRRDWLNVGISARRRWGRHRRSCGWRGTKTAKMR